MRAGWGRVGAVALAGLMSAALSAAPARAGTFTLAEALGIAYETNPQLAAQRAALQATDENVAKANAGWRPAVNAQGTYGTQHYEFSGPGVAPGHETTNSHPLQGQVTLNQPIFRGGRTWAEIGRAKALVRAGVAQLTDTEQTVLLAAVTAYENVVRDQAILELRRSNVEALGKQFKATDLQFKVGELTRTDVAQSRARLSGAQAELTTAQGQLAISRANFLSVVGRPAETLSTATPLPPLPGALEDALAVAQKNNPGLIAAQEAERAADLAIDDAAGAMLPQVSVQAQYGYSGSQSFGGVFPQPTTNTSSIMAQLTIPLYQGGADMADVRQAKALHSQSRLNVSYAGRQVREQVEAAWEAYESAKAAIVSNRAQVKANELAYEGVRKEQEVGARTILDVLNAEQELQNSQVALVSAQRNAEVAAFQLLAAVGGLTARGLDLKVKLYDPNVYYDDNAARWIGFGD